MAAKKGNSKGKTTKGSKGNDEKAGGSGSKQKGGHSINVRHILCEKYSKKEEALAKLKEGMGFNKVAETYSEDKARQGGSLGWKTKGTLESAFEAVAYALDTSTTTKPVWGEAKTSNGYHIIMVEDKK